MAKNRQERANQALRDAAAEFLSREAGPHSLITLTRAEVSPDFARAKLFVTVLPEEKEVAALGLMERNVEDLKHYIDKRVRLPRMPHIEFVIDRGEKSAERLIGLK